jgi:hypothetical protein
VSAGGGSFSGSRGNDTDGSIFFASPGKIGLAADLASPARAAHVKVRTHVSRTRTEVLGFMFGTFLSL